MHDEVGTVLADIDYLEAVVVVTAISASIARVKAL